MKYKSSHTYTAISAVMMAILSMTACKEVDIPHYACEAGTGGEVTLVLAPKHHSVPITGSASYPDSVFIKYETSEFPGDNPELYDLVVSGEDGASTVTVNNLKCGEYYIFMTGFDTSIMERVKGGIPVTVNITEGVEHMDIPVTED